MNIYKKIDELQSWIIENQARGCDAVWMEKVKEMKALMAEAYTIKTVV
jgi:hypothetical protein